MSIRERIEAIFARTYELLGAEGAEPLRTVRQLLDLEPPSSELLFDLAAALEASAERGGIREDIAPELVRIWREAAELLRAQTWERRAIVRIEPRPGVKLTAWVRIALEPPAVELVLSSADGSEVVLTRRDRLLIEHVVYTRLAAAAARDLVLSVAAERLPS